jgi:hypothetical protein
MHRNIVTPYFLELEQRIEALGGIFNAHLHLDRAGTFHATEQMLMHKGVQCWKSALPATLSAWRRLAPPGPIRWST